MILKPWPAAGHLDTGERGSLSTPLPSPPVLFRVQCAWHYSTSSHPQLSLSNCFAAVLQCKACYIHSPTCINWLWNSSVVLLATKGDSLVLKRSSPMNLSELPLELIDEILKHLDAISLAKSRQVCRSWWSLHSQPKYKLLWRQACHREIPGDVLIELAENRCIEETPGRLSGTSENIQEQNSGIHWRAIYQKWFRSRHIGKWPSMKTELKGHRGVQILSYNK